MEEDIQKKLEDQGKKLDDIYNSVEKTRKYFLWILVVTAVMIILPLIGLAIAIPQFLDAYAAALNF
ncbi:MAG: hypothetical protein L7H18_00915 [Candidatus Nealsonbacteria bacterium DGGOD1a]|nr:MAG: hypothetical protein L7H18_00915 [Candidatus Nealsonbacteria bacterium DGGOD1a]